MLTVACVLKVGGGFLPEHVAALRDGVERNLSLPHKFVCLSDVPVPCERIPLPFGWPSWWSKITLFKPGLLPEGPKLYFDLDVIIMGPLDDLATGHRFTVCDDFYHPGQVNSSMMAWDADLSAIYEAFLRDPPRYMAEYRSKARWGDQAFIRDYTPVTPDRWQWKQPGKVVSYKADVLKDRRRLTDASVVCFHGKPRPWQLSMAQRAWFGEMAAA